MTITRHIRTICILAIVAVCAFAPGQSHAQSPELMAADKEYGKLKKQGKYAEAIYFGEIIVNLTGREFGLKHFRVAWALNDLAGDLARLNRYPEAETYRRRQLKILEKIHGPDHFEVADVLFWLAYSLERQNRYSEAEPYRRRNLKIQEKNTGPDGFRAYVYLDHLSLNLENQGRYIEAEQYRRRDLKLREKIHGLDHLEVGEALLWLAFNLRSQRRFSEAEPYLRRNLDIRERKLGSDHLEVAEFGLYWLAFNLEMQNRYPEAETYRRRDLKIREKKHGPDHLKVTKSLITLGSNLENQKRYSEAEPYLRRALKIRERKLGADHADVAEALLSLGRFLNKQWRYSEAEPYLRRNLHIREKVRDDDLYVPYGILVLARNLEGQRRWSEAELYWRRNLKLKEKFHGPDDLEVAQAHYWLANHYRTLSMYKRELTSRRNELRIRAKLMKPGSSELRDARMDLAQNLENLGMLEEAEIEYRRVVKVSEPFLRDDPRAYAEILRQLAGTIGAQDRFKEAEKVYFEALSYLSGKDEFEIYGSIIGLYQVWGKYDLALQYSLKAFEVLPHAVQHQSDKYLGHAAFLGDLAYILFETGHVKKAIDLVVNTLSRLEKLKPKHVSGDWNTYFWLKAHSNLLLAYFYFGENDISRAFIHSERHLQILQKHKGSNRIHSYEQGRILYGMILAKKEKNIEVFKRYFEQTIDYMENQYQGSEYGVAVKQLYFQLLVDREELDEAGRVLANINPDKLILREGRDFFSSSPTELGLAKIYLAKNQPNKARQHLIDLFAVYEDGLVHRKIHSFKLSDRARQNVSARLMINRFIDTLIDANFQYDDFSFIRRAFIVVQGLNQSVASLKLNEMALRFVSGSVGVSKLIRSRQDLNDRHRYQKAKLIRYIDRSPDKRNQTLEDNLREELRNTRSEIESLEEEIKDQFPRYAALTGRAPLSLSDTQKLLGDDEALVTFAGSYDGEKTHVFLVRNNTQKVYTADLSLKETKSLVKRIRTGITPVSKSKQLPAFDVGASHELYRRLLDPAEETLKGVRHLIVVPEGPLMSIPFGVLATGPGDGTSTTADAGTTRGRATSSVSKGKTTSSPGYKSMPWLFKKYALTMLPSIASLKSLRDVLIARKSTARDPFIGFGDPVLRGDPLKCKVRGGVDMVSLFRGGVADVGKVRELCPLPQTSDELRGIASSLKADKEALYLGERATETMVKKVKLNDSKVIAFATHGLLSMETQKLGSVVEPALVLTPPDKATEEDDGLLTASEITQLKMDADFVILSACNTAAGEGGNAEGLSGLAKAFFYAGARSLLVSHWPVESNAATKLTTTLFKNLKDNPELSRAEAFRRSMMSLAANDNFAHPFFWAPFSVVGEGR